MIRLAPATTPADFEAARALCWEYRAFLCALGPPTSVVVEAYYPPDAYAETLAGLEASHSPPSGNVVLVFLDETPVGCGMFHTLAPGVAEIKRVFLRPEARGTGAGRALMDLLVDQCRAQGFDRILMDTGPQQQAARALYLRMGFVERSAYYEVPALADGQLHFFEMAL